MKINTFNIGIPIRIPFKLLLIMKLTTFILMIALAQVSAATFAQKLTYSRQGTTLQEIFKQIKVQTGYNVLYAPDQIDASRKVNVNFNKSDLQNVLKILLDPEKQEFSIVDRDILIKVKAPSFLDKIVNRFAAIDVRGRVLDENNLPLLGATITAKGSGHWVTTNQDGEFYLTNIDEKAIIVVSYMGYETLELKAKRNLGNVVLKSSDAKLEEVIVNAGYYTVKDSQRTGSISRITSEDIEKQPVTNVLAAMQGRMAGVNIVQSTGIPGAGFKIEIRGRNSLREDGNSPLYIIDGMPFPTQRLDFLSYGVLMGGADPLEGINPADIESIEVLKDADATAIYGSRGANGVVLITTKKGKAGKTSYTLNAYTGLGKVPRKMDLVNTQQYLDMRREGFANDGLSTASLEYESAYDVNGTWDPNRYTDWQKELIGGLSNMHNIQLSVSGGNNNTQFLLSGGRSGETTVFPGDFGYKKSSGHLNISHTSDDGKFNAVFSGSYAASKNNQPYSDLTYSAMLLAPNAPALFKEDGTLNWEPGFENPVAALVSTYLNKNNVLTSSATIAYKPFPGLELKGVFGFLDKRQDESNASPHTKYNPSYGFDSSSGSSYSINNGINQSWNIEPQLSWFKQFGRGKLNLLLGSTFQEVKTTLLGNSGYGFSSNNLITNLTSASAVYVNNSETNYRHNAVFFRANYEWDEKYIVNITGRRDGSSRFGPGKRFGNFGAIGAAWLFGKEKFVNDLLPLLSFGKFRASMGTTGNDQISDYQFLDTYSSAGNSYQGVVGLDATRLFNPDFSWESNKKLEFAMDLGFFNDRIFFTAAYFRNRSSNQLVGTPLPGITGFSALTANFDATVQNTGVELELRTNNFSKGKFRWLSSFNISIPRNKLVSFPGLESSTYADTYVIGQPLSIRKVYEFTGIDPQNGNYTYKDANGDGRITYEYDKQSIVDLGSSYFGSITNQISYGSFELDVMFQLEKRDGLDYWPNIPGNWGSQLTSALNRWQKKGDIATYQKYTTGYDAAAINAAFRYGGSDGGFADASYIRLKNISLAYTINKNWLKAGQLRIYLQAQNLFTITGFDGLDPETQTVVVLPPLRVITAGIKLNY